MIYTIDLAAYLSHHGIKGQKWGIRRFQNEDGTLTNAGRKRLERRDYRWVRRNGEKIKKHTLKQTKSEMRKVTKELNSKYNVKPFQDTGRRYMNEYNQKLAAVMNAKVGDIPAPSGRVVRFVAKRGEYGVHVALADKGYDMNKVKSGVWTDGRVAYKNENIAKR